VLGVLGNAGVNLLSQLASGAQDQRTRRVGGDFRPFHGQQLQQRQSETCGLAGAGLGRGHQVATGQHGRNGLRLHRRRGLVAKRLKGAQQGFDQAKGGESHVVTVGKIQRKGVMRGSLPYFRFGLAPLGQADQQHRADDHQHCQGFFQADALTDEHNPQ